LSNIIEEELLKPETFLMLALKKRRFEVKPIDFTLDIPLKLHNDTTRLKSCSPGVWKFTGKKKFPIIKHL
jgi:hypothetical protein